MNIYEISSEDSIGNSLSSVNLNYSQLERETLQLMISAEKYWYPMQDYYLSFQKFLKDTTTIAQTYSASWIGTATLVREYSATWIKPITIFYPSVVSKDTEIQDILDNFLKWIYIYFPPYFKKTDNSSLSAICKSCDVVVDVPSISGIGLKTAQQYEAPTVGDPIFVDLPASVTQSSIPSSLSAVDLTTRPNYVENQILIIYLHTWQYGPSIKEIRTLEDKTLCVTQNKEVSVTCTDCYSGYVQCDNGDFSCGGCRSCVQTRTLDCYYNSPPYELLSYNKQAYGAIRASIDIQFQDRNELEKIKGLVYKIVNCEWVFDKFLV